MKEIQKYFALTTIFFFLVVLLYFLLQQSFFSPYLENGNINTVTTVIFLVLAFFTNFVFLRIIQNLLLDFFVEKKEGAHWRKIERKYLTWQFAFLVSGYVEAVLSLKIFGILDIFVLSLVTVLFVAIIIISK